MKYAMYVNYHTSIPIFCSSSSKIKRPRDYWATFAGQTTAL